ncbi:MAG: hypothetical protein M3R26_00005 [Actinomycetota bacterium]|nr:hypothetical protein [Actinomycetota bacterium]
MRIRSAATLSLLPALLAGLVLLLALPGQAAAAKPCWERVIDDWLANGTVTGTYNARCLQQALKNVQEDLRDYSNVTDAINAALQDALRGKAGTSGGDPNATPTNPTGSGNGITGDKARVLQGVPPRSLYRRAIDNLGTTSTDSLPIPLLVLAGLGTLLLLTAGGLAASKRIRARKPPAP